VNSGDDTAKLWPVIFNIEKGLLKTASLHPSPRQFHEKNANQYFEFLDAPRLRTIPFNWGNAHFSVITAIDSRAAWSGRNPATGRKS